MPNIPKRSGAGGTDSIRKSGRKIGKKPAGDSESERKRNARNESKRSKRESKRKPRMVSERRRRNKSGKHSQRHSRKLSAKAEPPSDPSDASVTLQQPSQATCMDKAEFIRKELGDAKLVATDSFHKWFENTLKTGLRGIQTEYQAVRSYLPPGQTSNAFKEHMTRNRYKDIICFDATRVRLMERYDHSDTDYIHASHVRTGPTATPFICAQAPMDNTMSDFWRMVIQEKCSCVIMLCDLNEKGKQKSADYWPREPGKSKKIGVISIVNNGTDSWQLADAKPATLSKLTVSIANTCKQIQVTHVWWKDWPDRSVPENGKAVVRLIQRLNVDYGGRKTLVHCSAGIGRTGTLVALQMCMELADGDSPVDVAAVVRKLRQQRAHSVQTELQFVFIYRVLMDYMSVVDGGLPNKPELARFLLQYKSYIAKETKS